MLTRVGPLSHDDAVAEVVTEVMVDVVSDDRDLRRVVLGHGMPGSLALLLGRQVVEAIGLDRARDADRRPRPGGELVATDDHVAGDARRRAARVGRADTNAGDAVGLVLARGGPSDPQPFDSNVGALDDEERVVAVELVRIDEPARDVFRRDWSGASLRS